MQVKAATLSYPIYSIFAALAVVPVLVAHGYLFFVVAPSARGGSGPDTGPDLRGALPVFTILILGSLGLVLSITALFKRERYAAIIFAFYLIHAAVIVIPPILKYYIQTI